MPGWLNGAQHPANVKIEIEGTITPAVAKMVIAKLQAAKRRDQRVLIVLDSCGGDMTSALDLGDAIREASDVAVLARHNCNSAALAVLAAADHRFAQAGTKFSFHSASLPTAAIGESANVVELVRAIGDLRAHDRRFLSKVAGWLGIEPYALAKLDHAERTLTARDARAAGIIHEITAP
ncbi:MAG TPA: ATP-dependent Clp protease proteolytic subunit [Stellaceae bacterium]|nr:ATP-dependent Clp protease proteolytic subunit [Stellaceae bacterium]